jgi:IS5 family transposase
MLDPVACCRITSSGYPDCPRSAIEPAIGHMKTDGKLDRNWIKGALGGAMHAVLCGSGHNFRMILRKLRLLFAHILAALLNRCVAADVTA